MIATPESLRRIAKSLEAAAKTASHSKRHYELARELRIQAQARELGVTDDNDGAMEWGPDA